MGYRGGGWSIEGFGVGDIWCSNSSSISKTVVRFHEAGM